MGLDRKHKELKQKKGNEASSDESKLQNLGFKNSYEIRSKKPDKLRKT